MTTALTAVPRFTRRGSDDATEFLTLVRIADGKLAGQSFACDGLDGREYPYLIQIMTGPDVGTDGLRPVVWGLGDTEEAATADATSTVTIRIARRLATRLVTA